MITTSAGSLGGDTSSITGSGDIAILEAQVGHLLDGRFTAAVGSGTTALAACLIGVGVGPGDEVLTSALDWSAACDAILMVGATPSLVDIDPATLTVDPESAATARTRRTAALVATHLFGIPADVHALQQAFGTEVPVVEDCAQAWDAHLDGRRVGTLGDAAAFSFGPGKAVDAGEGGMAVFQDEYCWERAIVATQHRIRTLTTRQPHVPRRVPSRMHPLAASMALDGIPQAPQRSRAIQHEVAEFLERSPQVHLPGLDLRREPAWWRVPVPCSVVPHLHPSLGTMPLSDAVAARAPHADEASRAFVAVPPDKLALLNVVADPEPPTQGARHGR